MRRTEATGVLRSMLSAAGVNELQPTADDVAQTWRVFQQFAALPVEDIVGPDQDGDGLLVQYGTYNGEFTFDFTRQFGHQHGDEVCLGQLNCTFLYDAAPALEAIRPENLWSFGLELGEYFSRATALNGFGQVMSLGLAPRRLDVDYVDDIC